MSSDLIRERDKALKVARGWAKQGNVYMAQSYLDHAASFWPVSQRQVDNVNKFLVKARGGKVTASNPYRLLKMTEDEAVAWDCHNYFIKGRTGRDDRGLNDLFGKTSQRTPGDYYPEISELCLNHEFWLADPEEWTQDELADFADAFWSIVPKDEPNYLPGDSVSGAYGFVD